jgi:hypothetical protein
MADTVPMVHVDSGKTADVHPAEVDNWASHGWRVVTQAAEPGADDDNDELRHLRAEYQATFGKKPFHGWDAETLLDKLTSNG